MVVGSNEEVLYRNIQAYFERIPQSLIAFSDFGSIGMTGVWEETWDEDM